MEAKLSATGSLWIRFVPTYNIDSPSYKWSAIRFMEAYNTFSRMNEVANRIYERIGKMEWPWVRGSESDPPDGYVYWEVPEPSDILTEEDKREVSFIASETLHYVRSALDHLVYHASWVENGKPQNGTQFPILDKQSEWRGKRTKGQLGGMCKKHAAWIEAVQPFVGVDWTSSLQKLSNADKHRVGIEVSPTIVYELDSDAVSADPENPQGLVTKIAKVRVEFTLPQLEDTGDAVKTLDEIIVGSGRLINNFLADAGVPEITIEARESLG